MKKLDQEIVNYLANKLKLSPKTVKKNIYNMVKHHPKVTKNALAQIYATTNGLTVYRKLDRDDKASLPSTEVIKEKLTVKHQRKTTQKKPIIKFVNYETTDHFKKGHIEELNKAYTEGCYTAVFILLRKVVENLIIDILRAKYPENKRENKELYYDIIRNRFLDFGVILDNLRLKKNDFGTENKGVERLFNLVKPLKDDANDKTHSWFHLVEKKTEIDELNVTAIFEIIKKLEKSVGI